MAQETLARRLDVTMRTVQRHLTELEVEGFVRVQANGSRIRMRWRGIARCDTLTSSL